MLLTNNDLQRRPEALLFDCDGVLVDTEPDGHRVAFNEAFKQKGQQPRLIPNTYMYCCVLSLQNDPAQPPGEQASSMNGAWRNMASCSELAGARSG